MFFKEQYGSDSNPHGLPKIHERFARCFLLLSWPFLLWIREVDFKKTPYLLEVFENQSKNLPGDPEFLGDVIFSMKALA